MSNDENATRVNPYSPPASTGSSSLPARVGSFVVGPEQHLVEVYWSYWSGLEVYTVDGIEVLRTKNYELRGSRQFDAGPHHVVIRVDFVPSWRILIRPWDWVAEAYVDDQLVAKDVSSEMRQWVSKWMISMHYLLLASLGLLAILAGVALVLATIRAFG